MTQASTTATANVALHGVAPPLPVSLKLGWAFGSAGSTTILYLVNLMLFYFAVSHLGVSPAVAGSLMLIARCYDGVADLCVGTFSDRTVSRWGRRRPWMAAGAVLSGLGMMLLFTPVLAPGVLGAQAQTLFALVLTFTGYSAFAIPASAMPTEMSTNYQERTSLMAYRTFFIQAAGLVGAALAPAIVAWGGGTTGAYFVMGLVMAAFIAGSMAISVVMTRGAPETVRTQQTMPSVQRFSSLFGNRPFMVLLGVKFCGFIATASIGATALFLMRDVLHRGEAGLSQLGLASALAGMASVPAWRWIARFARKERVCMVALALTATINLSWLYATAQESLWVFLLRAACSGVATTGTLLMALSMLPDAIENDFTRTGLRREGLYAAMFEFFQKAAFAIAPFIVGLFLESSGYKASSGASIQQSGAAVEAVRMAMSLWPAGAYAAGIILLFFYRLPARTER